MIIAFNKCEKTERGKRQDGWRESGRLEEVNVNPIVSYDIGTGMIHFGDENDTRRICGTKTRVNGSAGIFGRFKAWLKGDRPLTKTSKRHT